MDAVRLRVRARSWLYIWWREYRYRGFRWANRRMFGFYFGRMT